MANTKTSLTRDEVLEYLKQQYVSQSFGEIQEGEITTQMFAGKMGISRESARMFLIKQTMSGKMSSRRSNVNGHSGMVYKLKE